MNFSEPFIRRPIGTILLSIGLALVGAVAYFFLPVASLPTVDLPTISVSVQLPGAEPSVMASTVTAPLERRIGEIAGVTELSSVSSLGAANIYVQFDLSRSIDGAARDVQAAINAAAADLPSDLPNSPTFHKVNPAAAPVLILALTSDTMTASAIYDAADTIVVQRLSQVSGVAQVNVSGADQPAIRIDANQAQLASMGLSLDALRSTIVNANSLGPVGSMDGATKSASLGTDPQLHDIDDYRNLVVKNADGNAVLLSSVATVENGPRNTLSAAWYNGKPAVILMITKQADANVIDTVDRIHALLPQIQRLIPAGIKVSILSDRTTTIRASIAHMEETLAISVGLVMLVVFVFLRRITDTVAAGITVPLALLGTCALMWCASFSLDNISLMALLVAVGFVVDDAIVMIENIDNSIQAGISPMRAALVGAKQIGFTVISISISLIAAFIPLLLMGGVVGRLFREFSVTLVFTIIISTVVSLSVTPMVCAHFTGRRTQRTPSWFDRLVEGALAILSGTYARTLKVVLNWQGLTMAVMVLTIVATGMLYVKTPKGLIPKDDTGLIISITEGATDVSFTAMSQLQRRVGDIVLANPNVSGVASSVGSTGGHSSGALNQGRLYISLKPQGVRKIPTDQVIAQLRRALAHVAGISVYMFPSADIRFGARSSKSQYQLSLWDSNADELVHYASLVEDKLRTIPGLVGVTTDREPNGLQANVIIDRLKASSYGVTMQSIDNALNNAFSQRQISTLYKSRNQYRIVLEINPEQQKDTKDIESIYVPGANGTQIPLSAISHIEKSFAPLVTNHQGQFPAITISYDVKPNVTLDTVNEKILAAVASMHLPDSIHYDFAGDAKALMASAGSQILLVIAALISVYIVLGVLYESLAHPLTIISTLPSAGLGALLALQVTHTDLSLIAFIGIVLLIGIVKKNGIMLVDFALEGERERGLDATQAIYEACLARFRPILMTTLAALFGTIPLIVATGPGSDLRRPLGITVAGGLIVSQILTFYTTPVIYLLLDRLHRRLSRKRPRAASPEPAVASS
ncbi:MAG: acriflavine resistance protein B [Beijerinckiaceae bacterium]|nr:MAG: acriflavine resistance protein B [Beijerinckiaceae bacterium]